MDNKFELNDKANYKITQLEQKDIVGLEDVMSSSSDVKMSSSSTTNTVTIKPMSCTRSLTCTGNTITINNCVDKIQSKAAANGNAHSSSTCNEIMFTCNCM